MNALFKGGVFFKSMAQWRSDLKAAKVATA